MNLVVTKPVFFLPPLLLDGLPDGGGASVDHPGIARIRDLFLSSDLECCPAGSAEVLRFHDISLLAGLCPSGDGSRAWILSPLVDPRGVPVEVLRNCAVEIACPGDLDRCEGLEVGAWIGCGQEAPGISGELTSFVLFQLLQRKNAGQSAPIPVWMKGYPGPELIQAYRAEGIAGVILPADLRQPQGQGPRLRVDLGDGHQVRLWGPVATLGERASQEFLRESLRNGSWHGQPEDLWKGSGKEYLLRLQAIWEATRAGECGPNLFCEASPYCRRFDIRTPLVQGPLSRIATSVEFASVVSREGGFPFLALAGLSLPEIEDLVERASKTGLRYGVGLVGVGQTASDFEASLEILLRFHPERVLLAAPQLEQVARLLETDLEVFVHAPVPALLPILHELGVRNFVLEGEEAGGHVSTTGGVSLWQDALRWVREEGLVEEVTLVFAGGIQGPESTGLLSSLIHGFGLGDRLSGALQMGSAYLATRELLDLAPLGKVYQAKVIQGQQTLVTGESLGLRVRQVATESMANLWRQEAEIHASDRTQEEKRQAIESCYLGGLRRAIESDAEVPGSSYMAGAVVCLLDRVRSVQELHQQVLGSRVGSSSRSLRRSSERTGLDQAIAIVGVGAVMPGSLGAQEFFRNLMQGRCFVRDVPGDRWEREVFLSPDRTQALHSYSAIAGMVGAVPFDSGEFRIPPSVVASMDRSQQFALLAAREALADAGYLDRSFDRDRVGVILGNSMGGDAADRSAQAIHSRRMAARLLALSRERGLEQEFQDLLQEYQERFPEPEINEDTLPGELSNVIAGRVAWAFDLHGENYTVDAACASSLAAVAAGVDALRAGRLDMVLTGGVDTQTDVGTFVKFSKLTALSATGSFPFDERGDGFVVGEGCGVFVLKRYPDALRDGDRIYALIRGWGSSSDGAGQGITAPRAETQVLAMRRAYQDAGVDPRDLAYVECHGTGTTLGDATEVESLRLLRGKGGPALPIGSVKAQVGHLKAGAGAAGLLRATYVAHSRALTPQVNFEKPRREIREGSDLRISAGVEHLDQDPVLVGVSSFGFGGTNFHLTLSSPPAGGRARVLDPGRYSHPDPGPLRGDLAMLFPGQGSQYVGMLEELRGLPWVEERWKEADQIFLDLQGAPLSTYLYPAREKRKGKENKDAAELALRDTSVAQPAIFMVSALLLDHLRQQGIEPAMVIGHSLGEYSALYAAGVLSFQDALRAVSIRGLSMKNHADLDAGAMAFLACGPEVAAEFCQAVDGYVTVANLNSYDQTVVSGETQPVEEVVRIASEAGLGAQKLPVAAAFHSRLVSRSAREMRTMLEGVELGAPRVPIPANLTGRLYPYTPEGRPLDEADRSQVVELLTRQIEEPVDFVSQIELAHRAGIRRFLEVGPKNVLARLVEGILQGKAFQAVALDRRRQDVRPKLEGLPEVLAKTVEISRVPLPTASVKLSTPRTRAPELAPDATPEELVRRVIAEISGYSPDRIGIEDDLERDLGIDTLKIFEIFSRLRSTVLPAGVQNFRELTTLGKILDAVEGRRDSPGPEGQEGESSAEFKILELREREVSLRASGEGPQSIQVVFPEGEDELEGRLPALAEIPRDPDGALVLLLELPGDSQQLFGHVFPWMVRGLTSLVQVDADGPEAHQVVRIVSLPGPGGFSRASFRALGSFVRTVQKDLPGLDLGYLHIEGRPQERQLRALLGDPGPSLRRDQEGRVFQDRLLPTEGGLAQGDLGAQLSASDLVLVSGGARGIAASLVQDLLDRTAARFLLLGRSPEREDWIVAAGSGRVEYLVCDVTSEEAVRDLDLGSRGVTVLVHAAGIEISRNLVEKTSQEFASVIAPKIDGARNLLSGLDPSVLRLVVFFSSIASLFGNHGQADYAAANGYLNGFFLEGVPVLSLAWPPWSEVGMATRGRVQEVLELSGVSFLSVAEGRKIFREALTQSLSSRAHQTRCLGVLGPLGPGFVLGHDGLLEELRAPLLASGRLELRYRFDLESSPYLADHRINQRFYLPAVSLFRQFLKRATRTGSLGVVEFQEVRLLSAVVFEDQEERDFLVRSRGDHYLVESRHDGQSTPVCELDFRLGGEDADSGKASVDLVARMRELEEREWMPFESRELLGSREEIYKTYFHGPRFQVLDRLTQVRGSLLEAEVHWDEKTNPLLEFGRIPWLLEAFFHTAGLATTIHIDCPYFYIPAAIGSCRVYPRLCQEAESARVSIEVLERGERKRFQGLIRNQAGEVLVEVRDLVMARSSELVPHRKAILPSGTPLSLAGCEVLQVEVEAVQSWLEECSEAPFTPAERAELEAHPEGLRRDQSMAGKIAAKILAREVLEREVHRRYRVSQFQVLSGGSPVQVSFLGAPHLDTLLMGWHFSISHSASRAVACVARVPCGVDIEELRPLAPESLERACTAAELRHYQKECASPGLDARLRALYQVALPLGSFCQREAVLKASGRGLSGYAGVDLAPLEFSTPQVARFEGELYRLLTVFDERYLLSVARLEEGGR